MVNITEGCLQRNLSKILTLISLVSLYSKESVGSLRFAAITALTLLTAPVHAEETMQTSCRNGDLVRRIVVVENSLSSGLSCEVIYWKDTETPGVRQVLWTAKQDAGYCYSKALALANNLAEMGWTCDSVE